MRNQSATDSQQQTVTIGGLAPSVDLLYQLPCPAHMPHPRWRMEREKVGDLRRADELRTRLRLGRPSQGCHSAI